MVGDCWYLHSLASFVCVSQVWMYVGATLVSFYKVVPLKYCKRKKMIAIASHL